MSRKRWGMIIIGAALGLWTLMPARLFASPVTQTGRNLAGNSGLIFGLLLLAVGVISAFVLIGLIVINLVRGSKSPAEPIPPSAKKDVLPAPKAALPASVPKPASAAPPPTWATPPKVPPPPPPPPAAPDKQPVPAKPLRPASLPENPLVADKSRPTQTSSVTPKVSAKHAPIKSEEGRPEKRRYAADEYYFVPESDVIKVRGDNLMVVPVHVRVLKGKGEDASRLVTCSVQSSHPDKICCGPLSGNVQFDVWARHLGVQPFATGTITVSGTAPNGKPLRELKLRVEVAPIALKLHLYVWKKGFLAQEATETLERACAFVEGHVGANRGDIGADEAFDALAPLPPPIQPIAEEPALAKSLQRGNLGPVAFASCRAELLVGDMPWSLPREAQTDASGRFRFALPAVLVERFSGRGVTETLGHPTELHLHPELVRGADALRVEVSRLPNIAALDIVRAECRSYPRQFFEQLCGLSSDSYNALIASLALLRASTALCVRYRQDYVDQRPIFKRAVGETFGSIITLVLFTSGLLKSCYDWVANKASGWILAVSAGLQGRQLPQWIFRVVYLPIRIVLRAIQKSVRWSLTRAAHKLSEWRVIKISSSEVDEVWEKLTRQVHDRIWSEYNTGRHPSAPEEEAGDRIAVGLLGLWEMIAWMIAALNWILINGVLWTVGWALIGACQTLADQLESLDFLRARQDLRQVLIKYIERGLNEWAKEIGRHVSNIVESYNRTGEVEPGLTRLSGALMNHVAKVERLDIVVGNALHIAYVRSRDRKAPARWQENIRLAASFQPELTKAWQSAPNWLELQETVDRWTQLIVKSVVKGAALGTAHAMEKMEALIIQGMSKFAIKPIEANTRASTEPFAQAQSLPTRAAELLETFVYSQITLKEYMQLLVVKEGLPCVIAMLYDSEMDQITGPNYNPTPEEGEEEPEPLRQPDAALDAARLSRLLVGSVGEPVGSSVAQAAVSVGDVDVLKRVRDFLAQPESPEREDKRLRQQATEYAEQVIKESGVRWSREQRQMLIESRIKTLQIKRLLSPSNTSDTITTAPEEQNKAGGRQ